jgi:hypothetical protein
MPASLPKYHSTFNCCLQESNARPAGRKPSRAPAVMLLAALFAATLASAQQRRIQLDDLAKVVTVSDPQISPDGKSIVCLVSRPNFEEDRYDAELVLVDVATGAQRVLTFDRKDVGSPRWSPSGDRLAFLAVVPYTKDKDKKDDTTKKENGQQVFVMPMRGGDAKKVTNALNGVEQFAWRPNGKDIAYVTGDDPTNQKEIEKHNDSFEIGDNVYLTTAAPTPSHIWLVSAQGGAAKRLTSGLWSLQKSPPPNRPALPPRGTLDTFSDEKASHLFERFARNGTWQVPTLVEEQSFALLVSGGLMDQRGMNFIPPAMQKPWDLPNILAPLSAEDRQDLVKIVPMMLDVVGRMHRAGVRILAGSDTPWLVVPGFSLHEELVLLVKAGFTPADALRAATLDTAQFLGLQNSLGTIETGKLADLVLLDANPLEDIRNTQIISGVFLQGRYFNRKALDGLLQQVKTQGAPR